MEKNTVPPLSTSDRASNLKKAGCSARGRAHHILHETGAYRNEVFNFMLLTSYMQPHLHPSEEKIEYIHLVEGRLATLFFDNDGNITNVVDLCSNKETLVIVPAFCWHTYVILSEPTITFETMNGVYDPNTWKSAAKWAPTENSHQAEVYLSSLKRRLSSFIDL